MKLVIVESPAKAKTINKYLGSDYKVLASFGHIRDLPSKDGSVNPDDNFAMTWELSGPVIAERLALQKEATSFTLEAGFLAKQVEFQTSKVTEATVLEKKKDTVVILTESQAVTEEGEVELVTFIQPQAAATPAAAQSAPTPKAAKSPRAQRRAEKLAAKEAKKAAKRAAKEAKRQAKAK